MRKGIPTSEHATLVFELTSFTADVLGKLIKPGTNRKEKKTHYKNKNHVIKNPLLMQTWSFQLGKHSNLQLCFAFTHLMNFRAKDLSFPVAAAAAKSRSRLFPDNMCPRTPKRPSGDFEWSASTV